MILRIGKHHVNYDQVQLLRSQGTTLLELVFACSVLACSVALTLGALTHVPRVGDRVRSEMVVRERLQTLLSVNHRMTSSDQYRGRQDVHMRVIGEGIANERGPEPVVIEVVTDDDASNSLQVEWVW